MVETKIVNEEKYNEWRYRHKVAAERVINQQLKEAKDCFKMSLGVCGVASSCALFCGVSLGIGFENLPLFIILPVATFAVSSILPIKDGKRYYKKKKYRAKDVMEYMEELNKTFPGRSPIGQIYRK